MGRGVPIKTPLTQEISAFVGTLQSKGSAVVRVDEPQLFRRAIRLEARRRGGRVRPGIASQDRNTVWAVDPEWKLSDEEYERASRQAANKFDALLRGVRSPHQH